MFAHFMHSMYSGKYFGFDFIHYSFLTIIFYILQSIKVADSLACPLCRKVCKAADFAQLPNNLYAICMLKMIKSKEQQPTAVRKPATMYNSNYLIITISVSYDFVYHFTGNWPGA